ncbi:MAG TPA: hypothetical protein VNH46_01655, partial [Gemmatimonadales bacterium]|nr:hypothetical protein [Gemmatimonadales bacterium]
MTKPTPDGGHSIDKLLEDRAQYVSWLTRLNSSGPEAPVPEAVRARVRGDYERRLEAVLEQLRSHTAALETQVQSLTTRHAELTNREGELKEQLAEAEVRHMVGEYDEGKWQGIRAELMKVIGSVRDELTHTTREIERLSDVLDTIRSPVAEPEPPPPVQSSAPRPALDAQIIRAEPELSVPPEPRAPAAASGTTEIPFRSTTPRPQPKAAPPKKEEAPGRTLWF